MPPAHPNRPRAVCLLKPQVHYRRDAFEPGLIAAGYRLDHDATRVESPEDVLVTWNRHGHIDDAARRWQGLGGKVIVAENGYIGRDADGHQLYAIARDHHLGAGRWVQREAPLRWPALGLPFLPWRAEGRHILILPQRGIGEPGLAMPMDWEERTVSELRRITRREIRVRRHPGLGQPERSLAEDLDNAWCAVIWASSAGVEAIRRGIPVIACLRSWILADIAGQHLHEVESPPMRLRDAAFERLAWAQWTVAEIAAGTPFTLLKALP